MNQTLEAYMRLFSRCEEMRPKHDHYEFRVLGTTGGGSAAWISTHKTHPAEPQTIHQQLGIALCRCSVEDWLMERGCSAWNLRDSYQVRRTKPPVGPSSILKVTWTTDHPDIHSALIACATAILDAQETK